MNFNFLSPLPKPCALVPEAWKNAAKRPRGLEYKNGVYFVMDAAPSKNAVLVTADSVAHLKELCFFLIWRYQKTYTRDYYETLYGKMFQAFCDLLDAKRTSLNGVPGLFSGIVFGDKQFKFKLTFYSQQTVPLPLSGAKICMGITVDRVQNTAGMAMKNPQDTANAYKEIKTIIGQELDYMAQNPNLNKKDGDGKENTNRL
ncbi:MAG: hypothetical protein AABZ57_04340 [Candidatus Margulisiibacteriota bacterium]